jgi:hypothetical protein
LIFVLGVGEFDEFIECPPFLVDGWVVVVIVVGVSAVVGVVVFELVVCSFCCSLAVASEEFAWAEVDDSFSEDPACVAGVAVVAVWLEGLFEFEGFGDEVEDEVLVFVFGNVHAPVVECGVDEVGDEGFAVAYWVGVVGSECDGAVEDAVAYVMECGGWVGRR